MSYIVYYVLSSLVQTFKINILSLPALADMSEPCPAAPSMNNPLLLTREKVCLYLDHAEM